VYVVVIIIILDQNSNIQYMICIGI